MGEGRGELTTADTWIRHPLASELHRDSDLALRNADFICRQLDGIVFNPSLSLVPIRPTILEARIKAELDSASRRLVELLHKVCWSLTDDPVELASRVGLLPEQVPLLCAAGPQHEIDYAACNGRLDVLLKDGAPVFLEANFSAANVDPIVTHFQLAAYRDLYGLTPARDHGAASEPFEGRARLYRKVLRARGAPETIAVVGSVDASTVGDVRYYEAEASYLRAQGFDCDLVAPSYFGAPSKRYAIGLKHYLSEYWREIGLPVGPTIAAHAETFFLVPDAGRALSSKLLFAWLSADSIPLSDADREFVRRHIPWTRRTEHGEVEFEGTTWRLADVAVERRREFVLKPLTNCGGKGVVLGRNAEAGMWRALVEQAIEARDHVLQRYVEADVLTMDFFDRSVGKVFTTPVTYVLGAYLVDRVNAGSTIRHFPNNMPGVVNLDKGASFNAVL